MRISVTLAEGKVQGGERLFIAQRHVGHAVQVNASRVRRNDGDSLARIDETDDGRELLNLPGYLRPKSRVRTETQYLPIKADAGLAWIHDEGLVAQIADSDRTFLGEGMVICHRRYQRRPIPFFDQYPRRRRHIRLAKDAGVERSIMQSVELIERRHFVKRQKNMRKSALKLLDRPCQRRGEHRGRCVAEMERTHLAERGTPHFSLCGFHGSENIAGAAEQMLPRLRQKYVPLVSIEQPSADFLFQRPDLNAERRLRNVQPLGGARKAQFLGDCDKIT